MQPISVSQAQRSISRSALVYASEPSQDYSLEERFSEGDALDGDEAWEKCAASGILNSRSKCVAEGRGEQEGLLKECLNVVTFLMSPLTIRRYSDRTTRQTTITAASMAYIDSMWRFTLRPVGTGQNIGAQGESRHSRQAQSGLLLESALI